MIDIDYNTLTYLYNLYLITQNKLSGYLNPDLDENSLILQLGKTIKTQDVMDHVIKLGLDSGMLKEKEMTGGDVSYRDVPATPKPGMPSKRPDGPKGATTWLNTSHINNTMKYYENLFPNFKFLGAVPQDCYQYTGCTLKNTPFDKLLAEGKDCVGIIFNLDKHNQSGSHWVALWLQLKKGQCYYCDSVGHKPLPDSKEYMDSFVSWFPGKADVRINNKKYQRDSSECGIYSINFIIRMLNGEETFDQIIDHSLTFQQINACRKIYFDNSDTKFAPNAICDPITLTD